MENTDLIDLSFTNLSDTELFSSLDISTISSEKITAPRYSYWQSVFRVFFKKKINYFYLGVLLLIVIFSFIYPLFSPYDETINIMSDGVTHLSAGQAIDKFGFSIKWILGTGSIGQSMWDQMWDGARVSISLSFICAIINMSIGVVVGAIWGFSKKIDAVMNEVYNVVGNVPYILLVSVFVLILSPSFWTFVFAMTVTGWLGIAYFIRTQVMIIRDREYNLASKCVGTPLFRVVTHNILPFLTSVIMTMLASELPSYISSEVFLSYIGMGIKENSLGKIIETNEACLQTPGWEREFWGPVAITAIITIVLYVVGQKLSDASDPKTHR